MTNSSCLENNKNTGTTITEKPQNGLGGLKHWPFDLRSGIMVAMVSLPFSMGIAITSGAPPICGVISAIVAGFILPFAGGSYVTISGPAAGLAPALFSGMLALATAEIGKEAASEKTTSELLTIGYPLLLVAIALAGILQVVLSRLKIARLSAIFPASAIEGMLAAIGLIIIVKQLPLMFGVPFTSHEFWGILSEVPQKIHEINFNVLSTGVVCTIALFVLNALPLKMLKTLPPPVWVFVGGSIVAQLMIGISPEFCINIPENPLQNGIQFPHFGRILASPSTWSALFYIVFVLILIDATESLATIVAVDKLDTYKRRSDPDRTLQSMGICNTVSSLVGGLTIIPGIVKSTTNIIGGGRTLWANFFNACTLLVFLFFARPLLNQVPLAVLAAILIFVGWKLCGPKVWKHMSEIGLEQFGVFLLTVIVTVSTDLLIGIFVGVISKLLMDLALIGLANRINNHKPSGTFVLKLIALFKSPVEKRVTDNLIHEIYFDSPLHCFNLLHVIREMQNIGHEVEVLKLHFSPLSNIIDHTSVETILHYIEEYKLKGVEVEMVGWEQFVPLSSHESAIRIGLPAKLASLSNNSDSISGAL